MRADDKKILILGGLAVGLVYFGVLNPLLKFLGIKADETDIALSIEATNPGSFWSPAFHKNVPGAMLLTRAAAEQLARTIYGSFGPFNDCEECVIAAIKSVRYQTQFSFLSDIFSQLYGQDLLQFLRGGNWPQDRLSDADVKLITDYISKLPVK